MRLPLTFALSAALTVAISLPVLAQGANVSQGESACRADFRKLCSGVKPGGGRIIACLKEKRDQLSPACQQFVDNQK